MERGPRPCDSESAGALLTRRGPKLKPITAAEIERATALLDEGASQQAIRAALKVSWRRLRLILAAVKETT